MAERTRSGWHVGARSALAALSMALAGAALPAAAQDKPIELRFSSWVPPSHALHDAIREWSASIAKDSSNSIKVTLYPAEQLGKANDHYDMARDGIADVTYVNPGYQAGRFPIADAATLPFMMTNADQGSRAYDEWYRPYAKNEMKDVKFCLAFVHDPGTFHSKKELRKPEDVRGLKVRSANATMANVVTALGGANVRVSAPEARGALESGVADVVTFPWESIRLFGIDKVVTHSMDVPFYVSSFVFAMSPDTYERMSARQKKVIDSHCTSDWAARVGKTWGDYEAKGREELRKRAGYTVYKLAPDELAAWQKAVEPTREQWAAGAKKAGLADPKKALGELEAILKKYNAEFK